MEILSKIFGSPAKVKILRLFAFNPRLVYDMADITRRAKVSLSVARREVSNLEKIHFLKRRVYSKEMPTTRGNTRRVRKRGWQLNDKFEYLLQLQRFLTDTTPFEGGKVVRKLTGSGKIRLAIVTGIFVQNWDSRIDMLIVGDDIRKGALESAIRDVEAELGIELRYAVFTTADFKYRLGMYDKLIRDVFDYPHQTIIDRLGLVPAKPVFH